MRHIIPIPGKDSLATAIVQTGLYPELPYEFVFNQTGAELPETFEWLDRVEKQLQIVIHRIGSDLEGIIAGFNYYLPSATARYCTRMSKIEPFEAWIGETPATVYFGIRADESRGGYDNSKKPWIVPAYPLQDLGLGIKEVLVICQSKGLMPPTFFFKELHQIVAARFQGVDLETQLGFVAFTTLFAGRSRTNCFFCWGQRQYEFVWLFYAHPSLFEKALWYERQGSRAGETTTFDFFGVEMEGQKPDRNFHWMNGTSLEYVKANHRKLLMKHADKIEGLIRKALGTGQLDLAAGLEKNIGAETLNVTSCGLFCGK
jgi:hypothetical protein